MSDAVVIVVVCVLGGVAATLAGGLIWAVRSGYVAIRDRADMAVALGNERSARTLDADKIARADEAVARMKEQVDLANARAAALEKEVADEDAPAPGAGVDELRKLAAADLSVVPAAASGGGAGPTSGGHGG